jgi:hypothetical protein
LHQVKRRLGACACRLAKGWIDLLVGHINKVIILV